MNQGKATLALLSEAFLEAIRQAVREEIQAAIGQNWVDSKAPDAAKPYLTVKEAAELARLAPSTIRLYIRKRQLKSHRVGRRVIIKRTDLESFLEVHPIEALSD